MNGSIKRLPILLSLLIVFLFTEQGRAQIYRVEHLPAFAPAKGYSWNAARREANRTQDILLPNGSEVKLIDTLGWYDALVIFEGRKVCMKQRDLVWIQELNRMGDVDRIGDRFRLQGVGHIPVHSAFARWLFSYDAAWLIALILLTVTLLLRVRFLAGNVRVLLLTGGLIAVLLIETVWGLCLGFRADWLCDFESLGMLRVVVQIAGYFALLYWQVVLICLAQRVICERAGVESGKINLRWVLLSPIPALFIGSWLIDWLHPQKGFWLAVAGIVAVVGILAWQIWFMIRSYRLLGWKWGVTFLLLYAAMLVSTVVIVPITIALGSFALALIAVCAVCLLVLKIAFGSHIEKINGKYYKVSNF